MNNPLLATLVGMADRFRGTGQLLVLQEADRLDGQTALITGASSGLGLATAIQLAGLGARVLLACRSRAEEAVAAVNAAVPEAQVETRHADLADLRQVHALADALKAERVSIVVLNAGLVPAKPRTTEQGFGLMFGVNYLANVVLVDRLLEDGVIQRAPGDGLPRIVVVSSDSHRSAPEVDLDVIGQPLHYGVSDGTKWYAHSKLLLTVWANELARRLEGQVAVHSVCPGAVNTNIAREAPAAVKWVLYPVMRLAFRSPAEAAGPVVYLCASRAIEGKTALYLHVHEEKEPDPRARDAALGVALWKRSHALLEAP